MSIVQLQNKHKFGGELLMQLFKSAANEQHIKYVSITYIDENTLDVDFVSDGDELMWALSYGGSKCN